MSRTKSMLVATAVSLLSAPLAMAGTQIVTASEKVRYEDLNLAHPAGVSALYQRLHSAAKRVCDPIERRSLPTRAEYRLCVADAMKAAVADVNSPALTEIYRSRLGSYEAVSTASNHR